MHLTFEDQHFLRDGQPALPAAAWIDLSALALLTADQFEAYLALLERAGFDCLLGVVGDGVLANAPEWQPRAVELAARLRRDLLLSGTYGVEVRDALPPATLLPAHGSPAGLVQVLPSRFPVWPTELLDTPVTDPGTFGPGPLRLAWYRRVAAGATHWSTSLLARFEAGEDRIPQAALAQQMHLLQEFTRKQSDLLLRCTTVGAEPVKVPPRAQAVLRVLPGKPVWLLFAMNPTPHRVDGGWSVQLGDQALDLGRLLLPPESFRVVQITAEQPYAARQPSAQPAPLPERQKGQRKAEHERQIALAAAGFQVRLLIQADGG
ncbi:MAG: hypothetical protein ACREJ2_03485 [Planctomycetota bacterium]